MQTQAALDSVQTFLMEEGLVHLGTVPLSEAQDFDRFEDWLGRGLHADMHFLERYKNLRRDPGLLLEGARSVISFGMPYAQGDALADSDTPPRIAQYARFRDYHKDLKRRAGRVLENLLANTDGHVGRVTVDSAPVLERGIAARAGEAFIDKNTCLISPQHGSFLLLGEIFTSIPVRAPSASINVRKGCGPCRSCQDHCPTGALDEAYVLDARKCIAYWTIEHRGVVPERIWPWFRLYYFGCDICQLVCPFNQGTKPTLSPLTPVRKFPSLFETAIMDQADYERFFGGTPATRAGRNGLRRNALIAMAVTQDPMLDEAIARVRQDAPSPIAETLHQLEAFR